MYSAPAKIILFGEHAVVYGQPAIAVPFGTLKAQAEATPAPSGTGLTIIAHDVGRVLHVYPGDESPDNALTFAAQLTLRALGVPPPDLTVEVRSSIPIGSGFGSGAAVTAALCRALSGALGKLLEGEKLNALVFEVEKMHHGTPSGIDNTVIVTNRPVYFVRDQPLELFTVGCPMHFLVANSGVSALTREAVGDVRSLVEREPEFYNGILAEIGSVVQAARGAIEAGDLVATGQHMAANHALLQRLTVSSALLDKLAQEAQEAGALGAKLSGGGRGGNLIALVEPGTADKVSAALRKAGAVKIWPVTLDRQAN